MATARDTACSEGSAVDAGEAAVRRWVARVGCGFLPRRAEEPPREPLVAAAVRLALRTAQLCFACRVREPRRRGHLISQGSCVRLREALRRHDRREEDVAVVIAGVVAARSGTAEARVHARGGRASTEPEQRREVRAPVVDNHATW
jgi:hypothetical protein